MICIKDNCNKKVFCEEVHKLNGYTLNRDEIILIPNQFYFELNFNNRLAKRGIPSDGFEFGCMKLIECKNGDVPLYINNRYITDFNLNKLLEDCNNAFREIIKND